MRRFAKQTLIALVAWLALSTVADAATIKVTWPARTTGSAVTQYRVERKVEACAGSGAFAAVQTVPATTLTYSDTTPVAGSTYAYRVVALGASGASVPSVCRELTVPVPVPDQPGAPALELVVQADPPPTASLDIVLFHAPTNPATGSLGPRPSRAQAMAAGINVAMASDATSLITNLEQAKAIGQKVYWDWKGTTTADIQALAQALVARPDLIPSLWLLSLADEPDTGIDPNGPRGTAFLRNARTAWRAPFLAAGLTPPPTTVVVSWPHISAADQWIEVGIADVVSCDPYRYGNDPRFIEEVRAAVAKAGTRPVLVIVAIEPMGTGDSPNHGQPPASQVDWWVQTALSLGARSIGLYSVDRGIDAALWAAMPGMITVWRSL